jgi:hypothetical protein
MLTPQVNKHNKTFLLILMIGLLTGTLDGIGALAWNYKTNAAIIFDFIASGYFGKAAYAGGNTMVLWGLFFHYLIAYIFTVIFYLSYPLFKSIFNNKYLIAVEIGLITWFAMNMIVIPLSKIGHKPFQFANIIIGILILIICIGMPIALIADRQYYGPKHLIKKKRR